MRNLFVSFMSIAAVICSTSAFGQTALWTGTTGNWTDVNNWSIDPSTAVAWYIDNGGTAEVTTEVVLGDGLFGIGDYVSTSDGALVVKNGGSFTSSITSPVYFGQYGHTGSLTLESGSSASFAYRLYIGYDTDNPTGAELPGVGNLTIEDGASLSTGDHLLVGSACGAGTMTMSGGTLNVGNVLAIGAGYSRYNSSLYGGIALPVNTTFTMTDGTINCKSFGWSATSQVNMSGGNIFASGSNIYTPDAVVSGNAYVKNTTSTNIGKSGNDTIQAHLTVSDNAVWKTGQLFRLYGGCSVDISGGVIRTDVTDATSNIMINAAPGSATQRSGISTLNQTGGVIETANALYLGSSDYSEALYSISDGVLAINQAGLDSTNVDAPSCTGNLWMGHKPGSKGTLIQSGGTVLGCTTAAYARASDGAFIHAHGVLNIGGLNRDSYATGDELQNEGLYEISGGNLYLTVVDPDGEAAALGKYQYDMKVGAQGATTGSGTFRVIGADAVISSCVVGVGENGAEAATNPTATGSLSNGIHVGNNGTLDFHINSDGISTINIADGARFLVDDLGGATLSVDVAGGAALTANSGFTLVGNATPMTYASGEDHNDLSLTLSAATMVEDAANVWTIDQTGTDVTAAFSATAAALDTAILPGTNSGAYSLTGLGNELGVSMNVSSSDLTGVLDFMADNGFEAIAGTGDYDIELTFDATSLTDANFVFDFSDFDALMTIDELLFTSEGGTEPAAGDANRDGKVDGSDVTILAGNWQKGVSDGLTAEWEDGDFNGDGKVDGSDVTILAGNWQYGVTAAASAVPEPNTIVLVICGILAGLLFTRRHA